jgi:hypothetical protein
MIRQGKTTGMGQGKRNSVNRGPSALINHGKEYTSVLRNQPLIDNPSRRVIDKENKATASDGVGVSTFAQQRKSVPIRTNKELQKRNNDE